MTTVPGDEVAPPIALRQLTKRYGARRGVLDLDLAVAQGEIFGFLGPNGAGKTTTIRVLMGLIRPSAGEARIFGRDCWRQSTEVKSLVGFLPGEVHLQEQLTGRDVLAFFAAFRGAGDLTRGLKLAEYLDLDLGLRVKHLSKGNRQKLAVVQALMHDAPLVILDEPSSGLDPLMQATLLELLREEQARGRTVFLSSHVLPEVEQVAQRVAIIREGRLVAVEDVARLKALREREMLVLLAEPVAAAPERLAALPGVRVLGIDPAGRQLRLAVRGAPGPLLRLLSELPVEDLTYGPPDLESVFLHYYAPEREQTEEAASR
ncbi:MAG TPA: ABC transporter ATP-binding protein [Thermomicrobiaceae bacterium]|nr:ABC transporter ATP-binding protein [Thermomicrobiaceae bacterium]